MEKVVSIDYLKKIVSIKEKKRKKIIYEKEICQTQS